jgi:hypothetical protein
MNSDYLSLPLADRLRVFRDNQKQSLGGGWHDAHQRWHWVPHGFAAFSGCWGGTPFQVGSRTGRWCEDLEGYFRSVQKAHEILSLRHRGWFVNHFQAETTEGLVLQLPGRRGRDRFMAACSDPDNPGTGIVEQCLYGDRELAAHAADRLAELYADDCRDSTSLDVKIPDYLAALQAPETPVTIGLPKEYYGEGLNPEIRAAVEAAAKFYESKGCKLKEVALPHTNYAIPVYYIIAPCEASSNLARYDGVRYGYVHNVYVKPEARGQGVARALLKRLHAEAAKAGVVRLSLHASRFGRPLYLDLGYESIERYMESDLPRD